MTPRAFTRLLQLASPTLPVGAYTYSQGLEHAIAAGIVTSEASAGAWIGDAMRFAMTRWELPTVARALRAWGRGDDAAVLALDRAFLASRETAELRAETLQMGHSLRRLLRELRLPEHDDGRTRGLWTMQDPAYPTVWSAAALSWEVPMAEAVHVYVWTWIENQVLAVVKALPLGQSAGQRLLASLGAALPDCVEAALALDEEDMQNWTPGLALASSMHETQYSRLFRS